MDNSRDLDPQGRRSYRALWTGENGYSRRKGFRPEESGIASFLK